MYTVTDLKRLDSSCLYWGERHDWLVAATVTRDSDAVERSNFQVAELRLQALDPDHCRVERFSHWAVGWVDYLLVEPGTPAEALAQQLRAQLADYPLLDEDHYDELLRTEEIEYVTGELRHLADDLDAALDRYFDLRSDDTEAGAHDEDALDQVRQELLGED